MSAASSPESSSRRHRKRKDKNINSSPISDGQIEPDQGMTVTFDTPMSKKVSFTNSTPPSEGKVQNPMFDSPETSFFTEEEAANDIDNILRNLATSVRNNNSPRSSSQDIIIDSVSTSEFSTPEPLFPNENKQLRISPPMSPDSIFISAPKNIRTEFIISESFDPETAISDYQKYDQIPGENEAIMCNHYLNRARVDAITDGDYDKAAEMETIASNLRKSINLRVIESRQSEKIESFNSRLESVKTELFVKTRDWDDTISKEKDLCKEKILRLDEDHERQLSQLSDLWDSPQCLRDLSKPSADLIRLRRAERSLVLSKKYKKAKEVKQLADKLESEETERNQTKGLQEMERQRSKLISQQDEERRIVERKLKDHMKILRSKRDNEIEIYQKRIRKFEKLIEECRVDGKFVPMTPIETKSGMMTPRSTQKIQNFRSSPFLKPLKIQPMRSQSATPKKRKIRVRAADMFE